MQSGTLRTVYLPLSQNWERGGRGVRATERRNMQSGSRRTVFLPLSQNWERGAGG